MNNTTNQSIAVAPTASNNTPALTLEEIRLKMDQHQRELEALGEAAKAAQEKAESEKRAKLEEAIKSIPALLGVGTLDEALALLRPKTTPRQPNRPHSRAAFPAEVNAAIDEAFAKGVKPAEVATTFKIGLSTAWLKKKQWNERNGRVGKTKPKAQRSGLSEHERERAIGWIKGGKTVAYVADHLGVTRMSVYNLLHKRGVPLPSSVAA